MKLRLVCVFLFFTIKGISQPDSLGFCLPQPANTDSLTKISLWATQYYIHSFTSGGKIPLLNKSGDSTGFFADTCDFCTASLEGTAFVKDSLGNTTVFNYDGVRATSQVDCRRCKKFSNTKLATDSWGKVVWRKTEGYGDGVLNYRLVPFRTIAVDKTKIAYGTVLFIPKARGVDIELPDGTKVRHDGYFFAGDTGGAIKQDHIDVFTGVFEGNPFSEIIFSNPKYKVDAYIVNDSIVIGYFTRIHVK
jgi:3D (Asp-Asp-Asp) domain-containing protein